MNISIRKSVKAAVCAALALAVTQGIGYAIAGSTALSVPGAPDLAPVVSVAAMTPYEPMQEIVVYARASHAARVGSAVDAEPMEQVVVYGRASRVARAAAADSAPMEQIVVTASRSAALRG